MNYSKMVPDHKSAWLEALRSGKYKQGYGHLRQSNGEDVFCCLGVLQEVIQPEDWREPQCDVFDNRAWSVPEEHDEQGSYNDGEIQERLMDETNFDNEAMNHLITMNDGEADDGDQFKPRIDMKSFHEIADWIEENL